MSMLFCIIAEVCYSSPILFDNFTLHMDYNDVKKSNNMLIGSENFSNDLFLKNVEFAESQWSARFIFLEKKLTQVTLQAPYDAKKLNSINSFLRKQNYNVVSVIIDETYYDFIKLAHISDANDVHRKIHDSLKYDKHSAVLYSWLDMNNIPDNVFKMSNSIDALSHFIPSDTREIEVHCISQQKSSKPETILINFSYPFIIN